MTDRRSFSQKKRVEICLRQGGKCASCPDKLQPGMFEIDHIQALVHGGDNEDDNLRAICVGCHKNKTRKDVQARSHGDRIAVGGKQRSKSRPMPGTKASGIRKRMNGNVEYW